MGNSLPPPAAFDLISSFARVTGAEIEVVLADPTVEFAVPTVNVGLRRGRQVVIAAGTIERGASGVRLLVRVARNELTDGTWTLSIERESAPPERIGARLLVQGDRPVVLLWGAQDPRSVIPKPRTVTPRRRAAAAVAGQVLDKALIVLPEEHAKRLRASARTAARRVIP